MSSKLKSKKVDKVFANIRRQQLDSAELLQLIKKISELALKKIQAPIEQKSPHTELVPRRKSAVDLPPINDDPGVIPLTKDEILDIFRAPIVAPAADIKVQFVDTEDALQSAMAVINRQRILAVDLEGCRLSRTGELCLITVGTPDTIYQLDVVTLREQDVNFAHILAFLEDRLVLKVMFDLRGDSDALYHQLGIRLVSGLDLQLLDIAARRTSDERKSPAQYRVGLKSVLTERLQPYELQVYAQVATGLENVNRLFVSEPQLWRLRPLEPRLASYAALGVRWMPVLAKRCFESLDEKWQRKVITACESATTDWRDAEFEVDRKNRGNAKAPKFISRHVHNPVNNTHPHHIVT